jgi:alpha-D-ribose 1-methylphosphonate 5-triphosphate synthase subunit PhnH
MKAQDLQQVRPAFHDPALGSQAVFRAALNALSHPGRLNHMPRVTELPSHGHGSAAALLLAMVDSDCAVWFSPALANTDTAAWLRFHTGCSWAASPDLARFLWVATGDALPALSTLAMGSDEYPDQSATVVIEVNALSENAEHGTSAFNLRGPGIADMQSLSVRGLPQDFVEQWAVNHQAFPRGVDVFLTNATHIAGLPRSTRIGDKQEA